MGRVPGVRQVRTRQRCSRTRSGSTGSVRIDGDQQHQGGRAAGARLRRHREQRAQPPRDRLARHPRTRLRRHQGARLRPQRGGPQPARGPQPHGRPRRARRLQPVLRGRRPRRRGGGRRARHDGGAVQQRGRPGARTPPPRPARTAAGARHPHHPGQDGRPLADQDRGQGHAGGAGRQPGDRVALLGGRGRPAGWAAGRGSPPRSRPPAHPVPPRPSSPWLGAGPSGSAWRPCPPPSVRRPPVAPTT
jgi:hypothetical protein